MLFNSSQYMAVFLPLVVGVCLLLRRLAGARAAQAWILLASVVFYGWPRPSNLAYLAASIVANFVLITAMDRFEQPRRLRLLQLGMFLNIGYLCSFKYINFFLGGVHLLLPHGFHLPDLDFPLGISFFTLTQIMYMVDVYERLLPAMTLLDHSSFVTFFPYVISGPLPRARRIQHQFGDFGGKQGASAELTARGLYLFAIGLMKKVMFADVFARLATVGFNPHAHLSMAEAWSFSIAFAMQMYFDFSGYSDMAIGSALLLGIEIPRNFDAPLRATSITDFWRRWHISLSQFITTYLYTPLVKAMRRRDLFSSPLLASTVSVFVAMTIAGLWHGPAMTFVLWGVIHGAALACNQYWNKKSTWQIPAFPAWLMTFMVFDVALVYFRAESVHAGSAMLMSMLNPHHALGLTTLQPALRGLTRLQLLIIPAGLAAAFFGKSSDHLSREFKPHLANALLIGAAYVACWCFMVFNTAQTFLYFKF